jgi:hypothetical protein
VLTARATVAAAQLNGRAWANERIGPTDVLAAVRAILQTYTSGSGDWSRRYTMGQVRPHLVERLLQIAGLFGDEHVQRVWREYEDRWRDRATLLSEGHRVLPTALNLRAIPRDAIGGWLERLEDAVTETAAGGQAAEDLTSLAETMLAAGKTADAERLLRQAVPVTLAVYERKDYQVSDWIELLEPLLEDESGAGLSRWVAGAIAELRESTGGSQANDAARKLLRADARWRPNHAWNLGVWLNNRGVVSWDDRVVVALDAWNSGPIEPIWWLTLAEQIVPIAPSAHGNLLLRASRLAATDRGVPWLIPWLRRLVQRAAVEAPPSASEAWLASLADYAVACSIPLETLGLDEDLHPDRRPPRSESRGTDEEKRDAFLAAHSTVESLLSDTLDEGRSLYVLGEAVSRLARRMTTDEVRSVASRFASEPDAERIRIELGRRAMELGASTLACELAERVLASTEPRHWLRHWSGGSVLEAFALLAEVDGVGTRDRAFRRLSSDAASDRYLLPELAHYLPDLLRVLGMAAWRELAVEVRDYLTVLLRDPECLPDEDGDGERVEPGPGVVLAKSNFELLASPYRLAVSTAQKAILTALQHGDSVTFDEILETLRSDDEEQALRSMSVVEAFSANGGLLPEPLIQAIHNWTAAENVIMRFAAERILKLLNHAVVVQQERQLPSSYELVIPSRPVPSLSSVEPIVGNDLERTLALSETQIERLAEISDHDPGILIARVSHVAHELAAGRDVNDRPLRTRYSPLGWTFFKPSVLVWERALGRVVAELFDADRLPAEAAMMMCGPGYDATLVGFYPARRPATVVSVPEIHERLATRDRWPDGLKNSEQRLATALADGWLVIGEQTDMRLLDIEILRECRSQCLAPTAAVSPRPEFQSLRGTPIARLVNLRRAHALLVYHWDPSFRGPHEYLALHPAIAHACNWKPSPGELAEWCDESGPVVRTLLWRSGWVDASPQITSGEVGEGSLVLAQARAVDRLTDLFRSPMVIQWEVEREVLGHGRPPVAESGIRPVLS